MSSAASCPAISRLVRGGVRTIVLASAIAGCHDALAGGSAPDRDILWRTPTGPMSIWLGTPTLAASRVLVMVHGELAAFDARTGARAWSTPITTPPAWAEGIVVHEGTAYVSGARDVFAVDVVSGRIRWRAAPDDSSSAGSQNLADERALYVGTRDSASVHALAHSDGRVIWSARLGRGWSHLGAVQGISRLGDTLYVAITRALDAAWLQRRGVVVAIDRRDGRELWRQEGESDGGFDAAPTISGDLLLLSDVDGGAFAAVRRSDGAPVWRTPTERRFMGPGAAPVVLGEIVYGAARDGHVYAMRRSDGQVLWRVDTGASNTHLARCGNTLLAEAQGVAEIELDTGRLRRVILDDPDDFTTTGFVVDGRRAYAGGTLAVYAFRCG